MDGANREKLYACIQATGFVCDELRLFLDTHPTDRAALEHWSRVSQVRNEAVNEYTKYFGPINAYQVENCDGSWSWVEDPWPWEGRC